MIYIFDIGRKAGVVALVWYHWQRSMISSTLDMIDFENHIEGCHGNHAFSHSFHIVLHSEGPNEQFGTHKKLYSGAR